MAPNSMTGDSVDKADERTAATPVGGITKPWDLGARGDGVSTSVQGAARAPAYEPMSAMPKPRASRRRAIVGRGVAVKMRKRSEERFWRFRGSVGERKGDYWALGNWVEYLFTFG